MFALSILVVLYFLLSLASASPPHRFKHVHKLHVALAARSSKTRPFFGRRATQVRCPAKVPGAKSLDRSSVTLGDSQLSLVLKQAATASLSWEVGTYQTALLELNAPELFLYNSSNKFPPVLTPDSVVSDVFASVDAVLKNQPWGSLPLFADSAVGDPASAGIPFLLRNWTVPPGESPWKYANAALGQLNYLLYQVPRAYNGAISHRPPQEPVQLWADFMSMAPPYISFYGAIQGDQNLVEEGYQQISHYYDVLYDNNVGILKHILLGDPGVQDQGHWGTGNGWAVNGMLRVLRIIQLSRFASAMGTEQANLVSWSSTILSNVWNHQQPSGALLNYIDKNPWETFEDGSGTALLAACTFRLATVVFGTDNSPYVNVVAAEKARAWVISKVGADGWLNSVVDPYNWHQQGSKSPEGQSFVLMLHAAHRDWLYVTKGFY